MALAIAVAPLPFLCRCDLGVVERDGPAHFLPDQSSPGQSHPETARSSLKNLGEHYQIVMI